jgi:hypothetical protein
MFLEKAIASEKIVVLEKAIVASESVFEVVLEKVIVVSESVLVETFYLLVVDRILFSILCILDHLS